MRAIEFKDQIVLVTYDNINRKDVHGDLFLYKIRHDDDGKGEPIKVEKNVVVNRFGSMITLKELDLEANVFGIEEINLNKKESRLIAHGGYEFNNSVNLKSFKDVETLIYVYNQINHIIKLN